MNLKVGQFWVDVRYPSLTYRITSIDYMSEDKRSSICELWFRTGTEGKMYYINSDYAVIAYKDEFPCWHLLYDFNVA